VLVKITRGLGGDKGILILTMTDLAGIAVVFGTWYFRQRIEARSPAASETSPDEVLRLGAKARGQMQEVPYVAKDLARVASFAVAQGNGGKWSGLAAGAVLEVAGTSAERGELWVNGLVQGGPHRESVKVHSSFLERYLPLMLGSTVELSDVRLVHAAETPTPKMVVTGWLRNSTSQTLSQCLVMCIFQDPSGAQLDRQVAGNLVLRPREFVRFATAATGTEKQFTEITLEISHATSEGLRNYLPSVVIPHSTGQRAQ
jgi:hypothetical protein